MNTAIVMLGSNKNPEYNLEMAKVKISDIFEIQSQSARLISKPIGEKYKNLFHNQAIKLLSEETAEETKNIFKQIESEMGRTTNSKKEGEIPIDIDLIFWNNNMIHEDYLRFDFVKICVNKIL